MVTTIWSFLLTTLLAGVLAGAAMEGVLWLVGTAGWAKADMIVALGSLFTKSRETAWRVGAIMHVAAAIGFAMLYAMAMLALGYTHLPAAMLVGAGIGFGHGLVVSLGLVWIVAEQHPLEEFNDAGLAIGLSHLLGHVVYGAVVGLVIGIAPM
ncbi:MAG TPA: hypothetical protein VHO24_12665 [Opitutaceae bacterium]|nr:hypothetical protein [Opitutaceae bacterium]